METLTEDSPLADVCAPEAGLDILNCGAGHLEIRFDEKDVIEIERAKRIIQDMLRRGYALFVHGPDNTLIRVKRFDAAKGVYIIADGPTIAPEPSEVQDDPRATPTPPEQTDGGVKRGRGRPRKEKEVPMAEAKVTVVGRSAGG